MDDDVAVPSSARLVRDFINTFEPQVNEESLTDADQLRDWLVQRHLLRPPVALRPDDHAIALAIREGLRSVLLGHAGHDTDRAAVAALDRALAEVPVRLTFDEDGHHRLVATGDSGFDRAMAQVIDAIRRCGEDHSWTRLKVCARDTCRWAFYDASRNQARRWCSMAGCGNYVKMRKAYAVRKHRKTTGQPPEPA